MLESLYETILVEWLNSKVLVITETWELEPTEKTKTIASLFAELKNQTNQTASPAIKKRGLIYNLLHPRRNEDPPEAPGAIKNFTAESMESESKNFITWFHNTYNTIKNRERLLSFSKFEYLNYEKFNRLIFKLHQDNFYQYHGLTQSAKWNQTMVSAVLHRVTENYKKYIALYNNENTDLDKKNYYKMRLIALQFFANTIGYDILMRSIKVIFEIVEKKQHFRCIAAEAEDGSDHAQNVLLLLGILYEKDRAEENFYASISLSRMIASTDLKEFQQLISEFNVFFIDIVNIDSTAYKTISGAKSDNNITFDAYKPAIQEAYRTLVDIMAGCNRTELEKLFLGEMPGPDESYTLSRRSTSFHETLTSGFSLFTKRGHTISTSSSSPSSSSCSNLTSSSCSSSRSLKE